MAVNLFNMVRRGFRDERPWWAEDLSNQLAALNRKVSALMQFDLSILNRILVGAQFLAGRETQNQAKIAALTSERDQYKAAAEQAGADLSALQAQEAAEDASEAQANDAATKVADEIDALVKGDQTPTVEVPAEPAEVVDVVSGTTEPTVTEPVSEVTDSSSDAVVEDGPVGGASAPATDGPAEQ
jgi:hypothetical protein